MNSRAFGKLESTQTVDDQADDSRLWDANDVARYIGASRSWVYHQAEAGRLPCIRVLGFLRFHPQAVRDFVQAASSAPAVLKSGQR
jgi:predicted DNA-binding transcriptional regulator AlpA